MRVRRLLTLLVLISIPSPLLAADDPLPTGAVARLGRQRLGAPCHLHCVAASADGKLLAFGGGDSKLYLADAVTGRRIRVLTGHTKEIVGVAFSPDSKSVLSGGADGKLRLWDVAGVKEPLEIPVGDSGIIAVDYSPDGKILAAGNWEGVVSLRDSATGKELRHFTANPGGTIWISFSADSKRLVSGGYDNKAHVWEVATGTRQLTLEGHANIVTCALFTPDGKSVLTGGRDGTVRVWDSATGKPVRRWETKHHYVERFALSPDGKTLATPGTDNFIRLWNVESGTELRQLFGHTGAVYQVAFSGKSLVSASWDYSVRLWDLTSGKEIPEGLGHGAAINALAFAPDGKTLATASDDRTVRLWEPRTGKARTVVGSAPAALVSLAFARDSKTILATDDSRTLHRWDAVSGKEDVSPGWPVALRRAVAAPRLSADARLAFAAGAEGHVILWDTRSGEEKMSAPYGERAAALSSDGKRLVLSGSAGTRVIDVVTGRGLAPPEHISAGASPLFSPDGRTVACLTAEQGLMTLSLFEATTLQLRARYLLGNTFANSLAFAPDGRVLAAGGSDGTVTVFDLMNGKKVGSGTGHLGDVRALAFSPDGSLLASAGMDGSAVCWDATRFRPAAPKAGNMKAERVAALWDDLAGENEARAYAAHWELVEAPSEAVALLKKHLKPAGGERAKQFARWIADLEDDEFEVRQSASEELAKVGSAAEESLRRAMAADPPPETKRRLEALMDKIKTRVLSSEDRRAVRALEILERIGTPEARQFLEALAKGADAEAITVEAQESLARLKARTP